MTTIQQPLWQHPLWRLVVEQMTAKDLQSIAEADYGSEVEENLEAIGRIIHPEATEFSLPWNPREVLELTRWTQPDDYDDQYTAQRHRLFAAMALLVGSGDASNAGLGGIIDNLVIAYDASLAVIPQGIVEWPSFLVDLDLHIHAEVQKYWRDEHHLIHLLDCIASLHRTQPDYDYACTQAHRAFAGAALARTNWQIGKLRKPWDWPLRIDGMGNCHNLWRQHLDSTMALATSAGHQALIAELQRLRQPDSEWMQQWFMRHWEKELS